MSPRTYRVSAVWRIYGWAAEAFDRRIGWHRLPRVLGLIALVGMRSVLRRGNLFDTEELQSTATPPVSTWHGSYHTSRTADGTYNDLAHPAMGRAESRFGRNVPLERTYPEPLPELMLPSPRTVSRELLTRDRFEPARNINALTAAWLQFMIKDWVSHGRGSAEDMWEIPLVDADPWPDRPMRIPRTPPDPTRPSGSSDPPTYLNTVSHWWDGSQLYGHDAASQQRARTGTDGKLNIKPGGRLSLPEEPALNPTLVPGWWLGLSLMASLFVLEHNAICDRLRLEYPSWGDEELFQHARLINVAVLAKIHILEWTPALISHPTTRTGMRLHWFGLAGERLGKVVGRLGTNEILSGIPGSRPQHFGVPYALTEEFVAVYRMHPLIADEWELRALEDDSVLERRRFSELTGQRAEPVQDRIGLADLYYSFGRAHAGALRLHNFPRDLQEFERPDGKIQDIAATDILRSRELGVPRYNDFRRHLHMKPATRFETLTDNEQWAEELRRVYDGDIERVDVTVGMFAEPLPAGFTFSDTAFRVFLLMAARRLNSDRFFTLDFTPTVYTPAGLRWIAEATMSTVLLRHFPSLAPALRGVNNAFTPFTPVAP